jgi:hypothetical protein
MNIKVGDDVEMLQLKLIGQVSAVARNWYTVEIEGEYFGNFTEKELKLVESERMKLNKLQQLLSDLTDASTVNDEHKSVIVVEDAIEMIEKADIFPLTPARGEPMPQTIEHYQANAARDQELILEQVDKIERLQLKLNQATQQGE